MITVAPLLNLKKLYTKEDAFWKKKERYYYLSKSSDSIRLILNSYFEVMKVRKINLYVPDYFCNETLEIIRSENIKIVYYPLDENYNPKWKECSKKIDTNEANIFLFVHYFGMKKNIERAREFCDLNNLILLEDCTHVLYPTDKLGKLGDFIIFSPYKLLAMPDGGILIDNYSKNQLLTETINNSYKTLKKKKTNLFWIIKKMIQKIIPYYPKTIQNEKNKKINKDKILKMSKLSFYLLSKYSYKDFKIISEIRKENLELVNYLIKSENLDIKCINFDKNDDIPYLGVFFLNDFNKDKINHLLEKKYIIQKWPDLPEDIKLNKTEYEIANKLYDYSFTLPIHQTLKSYELINKYSNYKKNMNLSNISIKWDEFDEDEWIENYKKILKIPITQDTDYLKIKVSLEKWDLKRGIIYKNNEIIGLVNALQKKIWKVPVITRINRGPLFITSDIEKKDLEAILFELKKTFKKQIFLFLPEIEDSSCNLEILYKLKYKKLCSNRKIHSSIINLDNSIEVIRKNLKSKWRNQLKSSEKKGYLVEEYKGDFDKILNLYSEYMSIKEFKGISVNYLKELYKKNMRSFLILVIYQNDEIIAFDIIYIHEKNATYLVGYMSEIGKIGNVNNLLLYNAILILKEKKVKYFDLGGFDEINTESITKFKKGLSGEEYKLVGEFINL